ncbi:MAG: AMP-binding protein, partial [Actinomycetota bacterium]|nr:AMP-binding protein [Actinomycetota bacterium]
NHSPRWLLMRYRKLSDQAVAAAAALGELDVRPDDRVLIMLLDGADFIEAFAGVMQQGAVPLAPNPLLPARVIAAVAAGQVPDWCWPRLTESMRWPT